jgi:hypothetical protein
MAKGQLPYESRGFRIRFRAEGLLVFQESLRTRRAEALDRMQAQSQIDVLYDTLDTTMDGDCPTHATDLDLKTPHLSDRVMLRFIQKRTNSTRPSCL